MKLTARLILPIFIMGALTAAPLQASGGADSAPPSLQPAGGETIPDSMGNPVPLPASTDRIVCLNSGLSVLLAALGEGDDLVGRDGNSTFPSSLIPVYVVAENSSRPNIELIMEKRPDLILADNMLPDAAFSKFRSLGIPTAVLKTSDPREFERTILTLGRLTGRSTEAGELLKDMNARIARIRSISEQARAAKGSDVKVFFENRKPYSSASSKSGNHVPLVQAGAVNIAADEPVNSPKLSVEYVMKENPDVIIRRLSGDADYELMAGLASQIAGRTGLRETAAVKNGRVHIIKSDLTLLLRYPAGLAYMASWFYPEAAEEIDAEGEHREIVERYFGPEEWKKMRESFVYP